MDWCRFEREIFGGRLWYPTCQAANGDLPQQLPENFTSADEYVSMFEALLFEEAREAVRGGWVENAEAGRLVEGEVIGWANVFLMVCNRGELCIHHKSINASGEGNFLG